MKIRILNLWKEPKDIDFFSVKYYKNRVATTRAPDYGHAFFANYEIFFSITLINFSLIIEADAYMETKYEKKRKFIVRLIKKLWKNYEKRN